MFSVLLSVKLFEIKLHETALCRGIIVLFIYIEFMMETVFLSTSSICHVLHITAIFCDTSNILLITYVLFEDNFEFLFLHILQ